MVLDANKLTPFTIYIIYNVIDFTSQAFISLGICITSCLDKNHLYGVKDSNFYTSSFIFLLSTSVIYFYIMLTT